MGNWQWLLDLLVAVLLAATLLRTHRLDRALTALRRDRGAFEALMSEFDANAKQAQGSIDRLRDMTDGAARRMDQQTASALVLKDDLVLLVERGEQLAERLDHGLRLARARPIAPAEPPSVDTWRSPAPAPPIKAPLPMTAPAAAETARVRSKAERDLLMALQARG